MPFQKTAFFCFLLLLIISVNPVVKANFNVPSFAKQPDGIIIYPSNPGLAGNTKAVKLQVVTNNIIRVIASPADTFPLIKSLITVYATPSTANWSVQQTGDQVILTTTTLKASVSIASGAVSFFDLSGRQILAERGVNGRNLQPVVYVGQPSYQITQVYETNAGDTYYGLGQHQDDLFNYAGQQVSFFQNNTEVAVPFLVSNKNYGVLWDNYSLSKIGDARPYQPLSSLMLFDKNGQEGWLTASYSNDKNNPSNIAFTKAESAINYEFLGDSKLNLPSDFAVAKGLITWEGSFASGFTGSHKLKFTYAGYLKVWIDGKLLLDRWRQPWNPGVAVLNENLQADKKYAIKIEWIPDGSESYVSAKWLSPIAPKDKNSFTFAAEAGKQLDYYFVYGKNMDEVISGYRTLTGKATMVPKWALGLWQSRERYKTQDEILNTVKEFRKRQIPLDNIVLDWSYWKQDDWGSQEFDKSRFPNMDSMIKVLHDTYHTHFMISVWPKFYEGITAYKQFNDKGWLYTRSIANRQLDWIGKGYVSTFYDAFNPEAQKGFWNLLNTKLYNKGIDAWWMDASEPDIYSNVSAEKRKEEMTPMFAGLAAEYLNAYPMENAKGIYEGQRSVDSNKRVFILTRSAFAGSQKYAAATWSGDIASRWSDMKAQVSAGLNFSMSGIPYWTMDIGGFAVEHRFENAKGKDLDEWREQMTRWYQYGAFCPLFRVHGQFPYREIFNTAPDNHPAYQSMLYYDKLRYRLMPYTYSLAGMAYHKDYTIMRALVMDFAADTAVNNIGDQFMFGPSVLVNPVYTYEARNRQVYLPAGQGWYNFYSGKYAAGGETITADAPYEKIPLFIKEGSIIPIGPVMQYSTEKTAENITLLVYTGKDASFSLYEDENTNYNYEKGEFSNITFTYNEAAKKLTVGNREGAFNGMLKNRVFNIVWINKDKPADLNFDKKPDVVIKYNGLSKTVSMR